MEWIFIYLTIFSYCCLFRKFLLLFLFCFVAIISGTAVDRGCICALSYPCPADPPSPYLRQFC